MAKRTFKPEPIGSPTLTPGQGVLIIQKQILKGEELISQRPLSSDKYSAWELITRNILEKAFGTNSPNVSSIMDVGKYGSFPMNAGESWWENHQVESLQTQLTKMHGLIELLESEIEMYQGDHQPIRSSANGHQIFLVHGHDEAALHEVARYLEKLGQEIIILREQPNQGKTIIEKFEDYADVGFALVLLTGDDRGGHSASSYDQQSPRARQNVIFELGYFIGRIGRNRVCALYRTGVEIPSDYSGVLYQELDAKGGWKFEIAKELKAAGFSIDMNNAV